MKTARTVIIVDDDPIVRDSVAALLRAGVLGVEVFASAEAWLAERQRFSQAGCLILEMKLPGMSGLELQQHMLQMDWNLAVIFLTGYGTVPPPCRP